MNDPEFEEGGKEGVVNLATQFSLFDGHSLISDESDNCL